MKCLIILNKLIIFICSILLFVGCRESDPIVGEWYLGYSFHYPNSIERTDSDNAKYIRFNKDNTAQVFNGDWCTYTSWGESNDGAFDSELQVIYTNCYGNDHELEFYFDVENDEIHFNYPALEPHSDVYYRR